MTEDQELAQAAEVLREAGYLVAKIPPCRWEGQDHGRHIQYHPVQRVKIADYNTEPTLDNMPRPQVLTVHTAWGPAPYVGRQFAYVWRVATDNAQRWVSGPAEVMFR